MSYYGLDKRSGRRYGRSMDQYAKDVKVEMLCQKCSKTLEWSWKEFTRWLRNHPETDAYICKECLTSERNRKHGESKTLLYTHWKSMFVRTKGQSLEANKKYYLDKKIVVCPEWRKYENFRTWALANGFAPGLQLSRKDHDKNYEPANCQWLSKSEHLSYDHAIKKRNEQGHGIDQCQGADAHGKISPEAGGCDSPE